MITASQQLELVLLQVVSKKFQLVNVIVMMLRLLVIKSIIVMRKTKASSSFCWSGCNVDFALTVVLVVMILPLVL